LSPAQPVIQFAFNGAVKGAQSVCGTPRSPVLEKLGAGDGESCGYRDVNVKMSPGGIADVE
jgi:hypothetical protein